MEEFGMEELFNVKLGTVKFSSFFLEIKAKYCSVLGSTKYDVAASTEEENERIGEWHRFLNEDDNEEQA
jgi:hypothetical protein